MLFFSSVHELKDENVYEKQMIENDQKREKLDNQLSQSDAHFRGEVIEHNRTILTYRCCCDDLIQLWKPIWNDKSIMRISWLKTDTT